MSGGLRDAGSLSIKIETPTSLATNVIIQFVRCRLDDRDAATRGLIDELRATRAGNSSDTRPGDFPSRVPKHGRSDAQFLREFVRRQTQRRECPSGKSNVILTIVGCPLGYGRWKKTVVVRTLKRGTAALREVLAIVSHLSADS